MSVCIDSVVSLSYYAGMHTFYSHVVSVNEREIGVSFHPEFVKAKFMENDPIVLSYEDNEELYMCECTIADIDIQSSTMMLSIEHEQSILNHRLYERFPVSLYVTLQGDQVKKKNTGIVKNISMTGMSLMAKKEYKVGSTLTFDLYVDERVIPLRARVARNQKMGSRVEHGLITEYPDYTIKNTVKLYLDILKEERKNQLRKHKHTKQDIFHG